LEKRITAKNVCVDRLPVTSIKKTLISWFSVRDLCRFPANGKERNKFIPLLCAKLNNYVQNVTKSIIFGTTVPVLHTTRTAGGSFFINLKCKNNTPPMPLSDAHLGGLFILRNK